MCEAAPQLCSADQNKDPVIDPNDRVKICDAVPEVCNPPKGGGETTTPPEATPPEKTDPGKGGSTSGGASGGGYGGGSGSGGGYGGDNGYGSEIVYRGVTYVNDFLPASFMSAVENVGNSVKSNLPAPVAKSLPNTGGGWTSLALIGGALLLTGRFLVRRFAR